MSSLSNRISCFAFIPWAAWLKISRHPNQMFSEVAMQHIASVVYRELHHVCHHLSVTVKISISDLVRSCLQHIKITHYKCSHILAYNNAGDWLSNRTRHRACRKNTMLQQETFYCQLLICTDKWTLCCLLASLLVTLYLPMHWYLSLGTSSTCHHVDNLGLRRRAFLSAFTMTLSDRKVNGEK